MDPSTPLLPGVLIVRGLRSILPLHAPRTRSAFCLLAMPSSVSMALLATTSRDASSSPLATSEWHPAGFNFLSSLPRLVKFSG